MGSTSDRPGIVDWSATVFRSDAFKSFYELIQRVPALATMLPSLIRIQLVIDANVVLAEIRWRLKRRNPSARSDLSEAIDSGILIAVAPKYLLSEIDDEHLARILKGTDKTILDAKREWEDFRSRIHLYHPLSEGDESMRAVDPDDVVYVQTCDEIGADAVHSRDKDLIRMGARVTSVTPDRTLRDCARSNAIVMGIGVSSTFAVTITYATLRGVWALIERGIEGFCSLPTWLKILIAASAITIATRPSFRERAAATWSELCSAWESVAPGIFDVLAQLAIAYLEAQTKAIQSKAELQSILPPQTPRTALQHARAVCLRSQTPLPLGEILLRMKLDGYASGSRRERADLRNVLISSGQFVDNGRGEWLLVGQQYQLPAAGVESALASPLKRRSTPRRRRVRNRPNTVPAYSPA